MYSQDNYNTAAANCQDRSPKMSDRWQAISDGVASPVVKKVTYYKYQNQRIIKALKELGQRDKAASIFGCGTFIKTANKSGIERITEANFCRQRLCQVCAWRRAAKFTTQMIPVMRLLAGRGYRFVFITLTIKNPEAPGVSKAITKLLSGWNKLNKRRQYARVIKGACRSVEVTYNQKSNTYHPHIHALLAVPGDYGKHHKDYITHNQLMADWREVLGVEYDPYVDIRLVRPERSKRATTAGAALETIKYAYKVEYKHISTETISVLLNSLHGRRLISFSGVIEEARRELQQGEIDDNLTDDTAVSSEYESTLYLFTPAGWHIIESEELNNE